MKQIYLDKPNKCVLFIPNIFNQLVNYFTEVHKLMGFQFMRENKNYNNEDQCARYCIKAG